MTDFYSSGRLLTRIPPCRYTSALLLLDPPPGGSKSVAQILRDSDIVITWPRGTMEALSVDVLNEDAIIDGAQGRFLKELVTGVLRRAHRFGVDLNTNNVDDVAGLFEGFEIELFHTSQAITLAWPEHMPGCTLPLCQGIAEHLDAEHRRPKNPWVLKGEVGYSASSHVEPPDVQHGGMVFLVAAAGFEIYDTVDIVNSRNQGVLPEFAQDAIARIFLEKFGESLEGLAAADASSLKNFIQSVTSRATRGALAADTFPNSLAAQLRLTRQQVAERGREFVEGLTSKDS